MLFHQVDSGALTQPLWDSATVTTAYPSNYEFVRDYTIKLLGTSFPNMTPAEVGSFCLYIILIHFTMSYQSTTNNA